MKKRPEGTISSARFEKYSTSVMKIDSFKEKSLAITRKSNPDFIDKAMKSCYKELGFYKTKRTYTTESFRDYSELERGIKAIEDNARDELLKDFDLEDLYPCKTSRFDHLTKGEKQPVLAITYDDEFFNLFGQEKVLSKLVPA